jgi:D-sedoheptulose 7-phosphate isomerase
MKTARAAELLLKNAEELKDLLSQAGVFASQVADAADRIGQALRRGDKLLACGNGGSAADASHLTTEFVCRFNSDRRPYPAISLATHGGDLTAIGNDYDFKEVFARQVEGFGRPGDVLVAFSTSGRSENVRRALVAARERGLQTISFLGKDGGSCAGLAAVELLVANKTTARIQEMHKLLLHSVCELIEEQL